MTLRPHRGCNLVSLLGIRLATLLWLEAAAAGRVLAAVAAVEDFLQTLFH
jgi:hypothetical protein